MYLPIDNLSYFIISFFALIIISLFSLKSVIIVLDLFIEAGE